MIKAFSDSSTVDNKSAATSIFLTDTKFVGITTGTYTEVESATEGELIAVLQSLRYIKEHYPEERDVIIYCDCVSIVTQFKNILEVSAIPKNIKYRDKWVELKRLSRKMNISVEHIYAHQDTHNSNKVCDILSNAVVQRLR